MCELLLHRRIHLRHQVFEIGERRLFRGRIFVDERGVELRDECR